jgi:3-oxoacyl-[acyl-carrier-protein] synthase-3
MANMTVRKAKIAAITTCVPPAKFDTLKDSKDFTPEEIQRFIQMVGVKTRHLADDSICCSDLCVAAAENVLSTLKWERESVDALIFITHTLDYVLPATACVIQGRLGLSDQCASFDVGLGCSGYCYGLWLATMMLEQGRFRRILLLVGETPSRMSYKTDRSVALLFGDAGSATALEAGEPDETESWHFALHSDGTRFTDFVVEAGGLRNRFDDDRRKYFIKMDGANIFQFSLERVPPLVKETMDISGATFENVDYFIFHQANEFIIKHLVKKLKAPAEKVPITINAFGNVGGCSIPLTITQGNLKRPEGRALKLMLLGYGVGLSWASALVDLKSDTVLDHLIYNPPAARENNA